MTVGPLAVWLTLGLILSGCSSLTPPTPHLRITNGGTQIIENLVVLFPEDRIGFGDIVVGATTEYQEVPYGVYRYAAYQLEVDGQLISQPVTDWLGEEPLPGNNFTYIIDFDAGRPQFEMVLLVEVTSDE